MELLCIIPARGGSKGIPRKNLRILGGHPLIHYAVRTALDSTFAPDVVVTSDDKEILSVAEREGAETHERDPELSGDPVTLDPVIHQVYEDMVGRKGKPYDLVVTQQPTSPLLSSHSLDAVLRRMLERPELDTVLSACDDTHLTWRKENGSFVPEYEERVNRQELTPRYRETGGFLISRPRVMTPEKRIGEKVDLYVLEGGEAIDIDTYGDWSLCEHFLGRKRVLFVVSGNERIGLGHVHNVLGIADELTSHEISFLTDKSSGLARDKLEATHFPVEQQEEGRDLIDHIDAIRPDAVVNDMLDTSREYVRALKEKGYAVIDFEDLGEGAKQADLVINAMYPEDELLSGHYFGHKYFFLKNEFLRSSPIEIREKVERVLIAFGGVDPNDFTLKVLESIHPHCRSQGIHIDLVTGFGYDAERKEKLRSFSECVTLHEDIRSMVDRYRVADLLFTSAGRTTFEAAALGLPTVVLAQNERELSHFFCKEAYGFQNLGLGTEVPQERISELFRDMVDDPGAREHASRLMLDSDIRSGKERVMGLIEGVLKEA
ncbi:MAG: cytidylyltransferase domain-containing protein [Flavobacteriales bacterium]